MHVWFGLVLRIRDTQSRVEPLLLTTSGTKKKEHAPTMSTQQQWSVPNPNSQTAVYVPFRCANPDVFKTALQVAHYFNPIHPAYNDDRDIDRGKYIRGYSYFDYVTAEGDKRDVVILFDVNNSGAFGNPCYNIGLQIIPEQPEKNVVDSYAFHLRTGSVPILKEYYGYTSNIQRYESKKQNILYCDGEEFDKFAGDVFADVSIEDMLYLYADVLWAKGYNPERVDPSIAMRYFAECMSRSLNTDVLLQQHNLNVCIYSRQEHGNFRIDLHEGGRGSTLLENTPKTNQPTCEFGKC